MKVKGLPGPDKTYPDSASCSHTLPDLAMTSPPPGCPPVPATALPSGPRASHPISSPPGCLAPTCVPDLSPPGYPAPCVCPTAHRPAILPTSPPPGCPPDLAAALQLAPHASRPTPAILRDQRLLQPGPAATWRWPLPCPTLVLLPIKCWPLPAVKCRSTVLPGNAKAESILRGVMHAWSVVVRSLNIGVNSIKKLVGNLARCCRRTKIMYFTKNSIFI
jgi:hypothetical protein